MIDDVWTIEERVKHGKADPLVDRWLSDVEDSFASFKMLMDHDKSVDCGLGEESQVAVVHAREHGSVHRSRAVP